jgi:hypothetical protein
MFESDKNPHIDMEIMDALLYGMKKEEIDARKKGQFLTYTGAIYSSVIEEGIMDDIVETEFWDDIKNNWEHFTMLDAGLANPTAHYWGAADKEGRVIIYDEYYEPERIVREHAHAIIKQEKSLGLWGSINYRVADPSIRNRDAITGTSIQIEYSKEGLYFALGNNDVIAGINRVYTRLKFKQLFITRRCPKAIKEHRQYRWKKYANSKTEVRNNPQEAPLKKNDHSCDAIRYGVASRPSIDDELDMKEAVSFNLPVSVNPLVGTVDYSQLVRTNNGFMDQHMGSEF